VHAHDIHAVSEYHDRSENLLKFLENYSLGSIGVVSVLLRRGWLTDRKNRRHAPRNRTRRGGAESNGPRDALRADPVAASAQILPMNVHLRAATRSFCTQAIPRAHRACSARPARRSGVQRSKHPLAHLSGRIPETRRPTRALHAAHSARAAAVYLSFDIICIVTL